MTREELFYNRGRAEWNAETRDFRYAPNGVVIMYTLRHGSTKLNGDNKFRGWANPELDDKGRQDAEQAGKFLKGKGIKAVYCSDLKRAVETAEIVSKAIGLPGEPVPDEQLRPWDVGDLSGKDKDENDDVLQYHIDHPKVPLPGGESLQHFSDRSQNVMDEYMEKAKKDGPILLVFHTSNTVQLQNYCKGSKATGRPESDECVKPGGVMKVTDYGDKLDAEAVLKDGGKATYGS
jgi:probable phosphoglycerate mutase